MDSYVQYFLNYGVLGLTVIGWLSGFLHTKRDVDKIEERYETQIAELKTKHDAEVAELKQALALERQRSDIGVTAGTILRDIAVEMRKELKP